jgi:hypothetical protein
MFRLYESMRIFRGARRAGREILFGTKLCHKGRVCSETILLPENPRELKSAFIAFSRSFALHHSVRHPKIIQLVSPALPGISFLPSRHGNGIPHPPFAVPLRRR